MDLAGLDAEKPERAQSLSKAIDKHVSKVGMLQAHEEEQLTSPRQSEHERNHHADGATFPGNIPRKDISLLTYVTAASVARADILASIATKDHAIQTTPGRDP